jgi:hypothetical protein
MTRKAADEEICSCGDTTLEYLPVWRYVPGLQLNHANFEDCSDVSSSHRWVGLRPLAPAHLKVNGDGKLSVAPSLPAD